MTLQDWLKKTGMTHQAAADAVGVSVWTIRSWIYNGAVPELRTAARVEAMTGGAVTLQDWCPDVR